LPVSVLQLCFFLICDSFQFLNYCLNYVCKTEEKLLERLDQAILDFINNPKKAQKTARIGTLT